MEGAGVVVHSGVGDLAFGVQGPQPDDLSAGLLKEVYFPVNLCQAKSRDSLSPFCSSSVVTSNPEVFQITSRKMCPFSPGRSYVQTLR